MSKKHQIEISENSLENWQEIVDLMAEIVGIPAGLIMRLNDPDIEVLVSSHGEGNPYHPGDKEVVWGSGLYCETVIKTRDRLLIPNALKDQAWMENPDVKLDMISYLGYPILFPDGEPFGTICVLDTKENAYSSHFQNLVLKFRNIVQSDLEIAYMNKILGDNNKRPVDYLQEIQTLRGLAPICSHCKSIRDERGHWNSIEAYLTHQKKLDLSHSICPACARKFYPDYDLYD